MVTKSDEIAEILDIDSMFHVAITVGNTTVNAHINSTAIAIGNSSVNSTINSTVFTGTANNASYLGGTAAADYQTEAGLSANVLTLTANHALTANNASYLGGTAAADYQTEAGLSANVATMAANSATYIGVTNGMVSNSGGLWITANAGLVTNTSGLHVGTGNGMAVDADSIRVVAGDGSIVSNATGVWVASGNGLVTNSSGVHVGASNGITLFTDSIGVVAGPSIVTNTTGVHVNTATTSGLVVNTTGTWVYAGPSLLTNSTGAHVNVAATSGLVTNATGLWAKAANGISIDSAGINVLGNTGVVVNTSGIFVNSSYIGTLSANNAAYLGGTAASGYVLDADLDAYQTEAGLSANVAILTANNANNLGGISAANYANLSAPTFTSTVNVGANVQLTTAQAFIGNSTANLIANSILVKVANSTGIANLQPTQLVIGTSVVNSTTLASGANIIIDVSSIKIGNDSVNGLANSIMLSLANSTSSTNVTPGGLAVGTSVVNTTVVASGANVIANTTAVLVGNSSYFVNVTSQAIKLANSTVNTTITVPTTTQYGGDYFLHANGTWAEVVAGATPGGSNTYVQFNDSTALGGTAGFTFAKDTNNALIANTLTIGASGNTINSTVWTGKSLTANNADYLGGTAAADYQTEAGLSANVAILAANSANVLIGSIITNSTGIYPSSNTVGDVMGNTIARWVITANSIATSGDAAIGGTANATVFTTTGFRANTIGVYPTSNTSGQLWGNTISRPEITANAITLSGIATLAGQVANSIGFYPTSNTVGQKFGNTIARWEITGNTATFTSTLASGDATITGNCNVSVTTNAASFTTSGFLANTTGVYPASNTVGRLWGNTIARPEITANSITLSGIATLAGQVANSLGFYPTSNTVGDVLGNTISRWVLLANTIETTGLANVNALNTTGQVNTATFYATTTANVGSLQVNTTAVNIGGNTVNSTVWTGKALTANDSSYLGGTTASGYQTTAGLSANVATLTANNANNLGGSISANSTGMYPTSNTVGDVLGNTIARWVITANSLNISGSLNANGTIGTNAQVLTSNGTIAYWADPPETGGDISTKNYQAFTATAGQTQFVLTNTFANTLVDVYYNGVHLANTEYTADSTANTITLGVAANLNAIVEVSAYSNATISDYVPTPGGSNTHIQFNDSSGLGGSAGFTFAKNTNNVLIANTLTVGASGNTINATVFTGLAYTANNASYLGGTVASGYQTTAGLSANVATLAANSTTYVLANNGIVSNSQGVFVNANTGIVVNAAGVFVNATYIGTISANNASYLNAVAASSYARLDATDQSVTGGARVDRLDLGNLSGQTITPDPGDRPHQKITNNGAGTLAPGSNYGGYLIDVINTTGAGAITISGWSNTSGTFDTTTTSKFRCHASVTSDFSFLQIAKVA